jgi:hypothetical protein
MRHILAICALATVAMASAVRAQDQPIQRMGYDPDTAKVALYASYIGFADFCVNEGVDFHDAAAQLSQRMTRQAPWAKAGADRREYLDSVFTRGRQIGAKGYLYDENEDAYLDVEKPGMTIHWACSRASDTVVRIVNTMH